MPLGVTGNTSDSGSEESWFEPRRGNFKRRPVPAFLFFPELTAENAENAETTRTLFLFLKYVVPNQSKWFSVFSVFSAVKGPNSPLQNNSGSRVFSYALTERERGFMSCAT